MNYLSRPPVRVAFTESEGKPEAWVRFFTQLEELFNTLQATGTTAQRPNPAPFVGFRYFDTTVNRPIWAKTITPTTWVYADGSPA